MLTSWIQLFLGIFGGCITSVLFVYVAVRIVKNRHDNRRKKRISSQGQQLETMESVVPKNTRRGAFGLPLFYKPERKPARVSNHRHEEKKKLRQNRKKHRRAVHSGRRSN